MAAPIPAKDIDEFNIPKGNIFKKLAYIFAFIGPASMICSTSMGPGTASSCIQAGSIFGYDMMWVIVLSGLMCGVVAYIGAKITAISGMTVFDFIRSKLGNVGTYILFSVVFCTWLMVIYSQGATMKHLNDLFFDSKVSPIAFVITLAIIAYLYVSSTNNRVIKIASAMCMVMAVMFFINVFVVKPDVGAMAKGMIPHFPTKEQAIILAGVVGGSAPGTSALWYSYGVKNQKWDKPSALNFIKWDQIMFAGMFTIFSLGIFLSGAAVLHPAAVEVNSALDAAKALEPLIGSFGRWIFLLGLWGAVFTTIGGMSTLLSNGLNNLFHISESNSDLKVRLLILIGVGASLLGGLSGGNAMALLVNFIGLLNIGGLVIIGILVYFTCSKKFAGEYRNNWFTTIVGILIVLFNVYSAWTYIARFL